MADIQSWLTGNRNYFDGLQLLREHGATEFMLELLADGPDEYNTPKLLQELTALHLIQPSVPVAHPMPGNGSGSNERLNAQFWNIPSPTYVPDHNLEKTIRIKEQIKQLFKEIGHLKPQLLTARTRAKRYELARELATRDMRKQDLWEHLHYFEENGVWFDELPENQPKPYNLERDIKNQMANRTKTQKYLDSPLPVAKRKFYQAKLDAINLKIDNLKKLR
jgi:hypothetical protein